MDANFIEGEEVVQQADIPVRGASRPDVPQYLRILPSEIFGAYCRHSSRPHVRYAARVHDGSRHTVARVEQQKHSEF